MVFSSTVFLFVYLPVVLIGYYFPLLKNNRNYKNIFLFIASIFFYAWGEPVYVWLMLCSIVVTWLMGILIDNRKKEKLWLCISVIYHVGILFTFKYLSFLENEFFKLIGKNTENFDIALPIGISFFTFQMLSYIFDVYYGTAKVQKNILNLGLYVALFPQLIAGPIVRYESIEKEILYRTEDREDFYEGIKRFVIGLGKKALIADFLALIANDIYSLNQTGNLDMVTGWIGAIAYMLQIYFDFSGYSDMAIGLGKCFGFHFKENFNYPYSAQSIQDFWKRWHISLTDWFRDYVYIPMGGNKVSIQRHILNVAVVWILTGIWHGANWTFLLWGGVYCIFQLLEKYCYNVNRWPKAVRHFYTLIIICLCWVIFRADSVKSAFQYIMVLFGIQGLYSAKSVTYFLNSIGTIMIGVLFCLPVKNFIINKLTSLRGNIIIEIVEYVFLCLVLIMVAALSISGGYSDFIYFNF